MLQWMGGVRRMVREKKDSLQTRQRRFFEQQRQKKDLVADQLKGLTGNSSQQNPSKSLDLVNLASLLPPIREQSAPVRRTADDIPQNLDISVDHEHDRRARSRSPPRPTQEKISQSTASTKGNSVRNVNDTEVPSCTDGPTVRSSIGGKEVPSLRPVKDRLGQVNTRVAVECQSAPSFPSIKAEQAGASSRGAGILSQRNTKVQQHHDVAPCGSMRKREAPSPTAEVALHEMDTGVLRQGARPFPDLEAEKGFVTKKKYGKSMHDVTGEAPQTPTDAVQHFSKHSRKSTPDKLSLLDIIDDDNHVHQTKKPPIEEYASFAVGGIGGVGVKSPNMMDQSSVGFQDTLVFSTPPNRPFAAPFSEHLYCTPPPQKEFFVSQEPTYSTPPAQETSSLFDEPSCRTPPNLSGCFTEPIYSTPPHKLSAAYMETTRHISVGEFGESSAGFPSSINHCTPPSGRTTIERYTLDKLSDTSDVWQSEHQMSEFSHTSELWNKADHVIEAQRCQIFPCSSPEAATLQDDCEVDSAIKLLGSQSCAEDTSARPPSKKRLVSKQELNFSRKSKPCPPVKHQHSNAAVGNQEGQQAPTLVHQQSTQWVENQEHKQAADLEQLKAYCGTLESYVIELKLIQRAVGLETSMQ